MEPEELARLLGISLIACEPEDGNGDGGGTSTGGDPKSLDDDDDNAGGGQGVPQSQIDQIVQARLAREREQFQKQLKEAGFSDLKEAKKARQRLKEIEQKKLEEEGNLRELVEKIREEKDQENAQLREQLTRAQREAQAEKISRAVSNAVAAENALAPEQVSALISGSVRIEDGKTVVVDSQGNRRLDGKGNDLTVRAYVKEFLNDNPHFKRSASGQGAGSRGGAPTGNGGKLDPSKLKDGDYIRKNRDEVLAAIKRGDV